MPIKEVRSSLAPREGGAAARLRSFTLAAEPEVEEADDEAVDEEVTEGISEVLEATSAHDDESLQAFLKLFFQLNPEPSDEQVHALATSINITPEHLEEVVYKAIGGNETGA